MKNSSESQPTVREEEGWEKLVGGWISLYQYIIHMQVDINYDAMHEIQYRIKCQYNIGYNR